MRSLFASSKGGKGAGDSVDWEALVTDYDGVRELIARVIPGFENMNTRVRRKGGFILPNAARTREWRVPGGRARFTINPRPTRELAPGQYLMMTIRSHDQFNTTIYTDNDRYRGIHGSRRVVLLNAEDLRAEGLTEGATVDLVSHFRGEERIAPAFTTVAYDLPRGAAATYYPEANVLVPLGLHDPRSFTPASKSVVISLRRAL